MKNRKRIAALSSLLLTLPLLFLSGCFNYQEAIVFDENGAGAMTYSFERGRQNILTKAAAEYQFDNPVEDETKLNASKPTGLMLEEFKKSDQSDGKVVFTGKLKFKHLDLFSQWKGHGEIEQVFGGISLRRVDNEWVFERKLLPLNPDQLASAKKDTLNSQVILKLTGPGKLVDHNATTTEGNTCIWKGSFAELLAGKDGSGSILKARYSLPSNSSRLMILGGVLGFVVALIVAWRRNRKRDAAA